MKPFEPKPRECKQCGSLFTPLRAMAQVCSPLCATRLIKARRAAEKVELKERKAALKRIPDLIAEAQKAFNAYIRERDKNQPCICCGNPLGHGDVGGGFDCGHYRSTGSAPHLRFHEDNAAGQRKVCNRYGAGRAVDYRLGLIARIGKERVEALESANEIHKLTMFDGSLYVATANRVYQLDGDTLRPIEFIGLPVIDPKMLEVGK